jgi:hypothetical protein
MSDSSTRVAPSSSMEKSVRTIETQIDIAATGEQVWSVLTDFADYPNWNYFIVKIEGRPDIGSNLRVRIKPPGRTAMTFRPKALTAARNRELRWLGHLIVPGLFDGKHSFRIEDRGRACRFHQSERFSGILVPLFGTGMLDAT